MIIEARDDKVTLSGSMHKNLWPSIQAVAYMLLRLHPKGILIDASCITECSVDGAKTFLDAIEYIERYKARIVLCAVPESVMAVLRSVPGVRSQVPISATCEAARASLEVASHLRSDERHHGRQTDETAKPKYILVPILPDVASVREAIGIADALGRPMPDHHGTKASAVRIHVALIIVVPHSMPLNAPMLDQEEQARLLITETESLASANQIDLKVEITRARDASDEIAALATRLEAAKIVLVIPPQLYENDSTNLIRSVVHKAPCEIVLKR